MSVIKKGTSSEKERAAGLGRGLSELLDDNDGIPNMKSNVVIRRDDGSKVKIYDKRGGEKENPNRTLVKKIK
jgi:hypothetical protein